MSATGPRISFAGSAGKNIEDFYWERNGCNDNVYDAVVLKAEVIHDPIKNRSQIQLDIGVDTESRGRGWSGRTWIPLEAVKERVNYLAALGFGHQERNGIEFSPNDLIRAECRVKIKRLMDKKKQEILPRIVGLLAANGSDGTVRYRPLGESVPTQDAAQTTAPAEAVAEGDDVPF